MKPRSAAPARRKRGWGAAGKVIVFGIIKRNGLVKAAPIPAHDRASIMQVIQPQSREGSLYYTDEWQAYATLRLRGDHVVIRKEKGRPVGHDHINGIEGFWSYAKNWLYPYRGVPKKFFHLYLGETLLPVQSPGLGSQAIDYQAFEEHGAGPDPAESGPA